jgi:putative hydrolase of the HAD superfamily
MAQYNHLFFDLDHTLWDFERNSAASLTDIYHNFALQSHGVASLENFIENFIEINTQLWNSFDRGQITHGHIREHRFRLVFEALKVPLPTFATALGEEYLRLLPQHSYLLDGAVELLDYCTSKGYELHIISNGFDYIQAQKMASSRIDHYFKNVITNENAGAKKPDYQIFDYALKRAAATKIESLMIGDNWEADVVGALRFGIDAAYYNPAGNSCAEPPTYDVRHLNDLCKIL